MKIDHIRSFLHTVCSVSVIYSYFFIVVFFFATIKLVITGLISLYS